MKTFCPVCGIDFIPFTAGKPKTYCSSNCRDYMKYKNALEKVIIALRPTKEAKKLIKGNMFRLSNLVLNGTNSAARKIND